MFKVLTGILAVQFLLFPMSADSVAQKPVKALRINQNDISLDGILAEQVWKTAPVSNLTQKDPAEGEPATEPTNLWVAYDDKYIYIGARMLDSKADSIDMNLGRKDASIETDWLNIFLDPYFDKTTGYYFSLSPGGAMRDGVIFNDSWDDETWDGVWEGTASVDKDGWSAEMRIPFSQLRFKDAEKLVWGINFSREIKRNKENSYYVMVPKKESGFVSKFARLEGIEKIKPKQRFEILPYFVQKAQSLIHDPNDPFYKSNQFDNSIGVDLKIGLGTNVNIDATFNPDFGQVEVDPAVINLSAFESYFQEKRPFFIEGANSFNFGVDGSNNNWGFNFGTPELFYSRRIGRSPGGGTSVAEYTDFPSSTRILGAAKISGKIDDHTTIGGISAVTERTYAKLWNNGASTSEEVEPFTHYGVARFKTELNDKRQMLGVILTTVNRDLENTALKARFAKNAFVLGLDGYSFLDDAKMYVITAAFAGSYVGGTKEFIQKLQKAPIRYYQRPDATYAVFDSTRTSLSGLYGRLMLNKQSGNFYINAALGAITPGMEYNDLGFQFMADRINGHLVMGYRWYEPDGIFRNKSIYVSHAESYDFDGNNSNNFIWFNSNFTLMNYWGFAVNGNYSFESVSKSGTRGGPLMLNAGGYSLGFYSYSDSRDKITFELGYNMASEDNSGNYYNVSFYTNWKPNSRLNISFGPSYDIIHDPVQWVNNYEDNFASATYGTRYIFGTIDQKSVSANIRIDWTFTPKLSLQLFAQPFIAVGRYSEFKELKKPGTREFLVYGSEGYDINYNQIDDQYLVHPSGAPDFIISNPDFNFKSLRGNLVLRWEVLPGSILYAVWSHDQANFDNPGEFNLRNDLRDLMSEKGNDIFLLKFSYWLDV